MHVIRLLLKQFFKTDESKFYTESFLCSFHVRSESCNSELKIDTAMGFKKILSRTAFWHNYNWARKAVCSNYRFTGLKEGFNGKRMVDTSASCDCNWSYGVVGTARLSYHFHMSKFTCTTQMTVNNVSGIYPTAPCIYPLLRVEEELLH